MRRGSVVHRSGLYYKKTDTIRMKFKTRRRSLSSVLLIHYQTARKREAFRQQDLWIAIFCAVCVTLPLFFCVVQMRRNGRPNYFLRSHRRVIGAYNATSSKINFVQDWRNTLLQSLPVLIPTGGIVHVIQTQMELGSEIKTGLARMALFRTFCLPNMVKQTIFNFLWIIRIDDSVPSELLSSLRSMLKPYPHFLLLQNATWDVNIHIQDENWEHVQQRVVSGSIDLAHKYYLAAKSNVVLETSHNAEDALNHVFVDAIQEAAKPLLLSRNNQRDATENTTHERAWYYFCLNNIVEWSPTDALEPRGHLEYIERKCLPLTVGYVPEATKIPGINYRNFTSCSKKNQCRVQLHGIFAGIVRPRTPASLDENRMAYKHYFAYGNLTESSKAQLIAMNELRWQVVKSDFTLDDVALFQTNTLLKNQQLVTL